MWSKRKSQVGDFKVRLDIVAAIVGIVAGGAAVIELLHPFKKLSNADLELVDFRIDSAGPKAKVQVKLRNRGGSVAFLKDADLALIQPTITKETTDFASNVIPIYYNWLITASDAQRRESHIGLSRRIDSNDVDSLEFTVAYEELKSQLTSDCKLVIHYNKNQALTTGLSEIKIGNSAGEMPTYRLSDDSSALVDSLPQTSADYTRIEILRELSNRKYEPAKNAIRPYLQSSTPDVRAGAAHYYSNVLDPDVVADVAAMLRDSNARVREEAYNALSFHGIYALNELSHLINDANPEMRDVAATLLGNIHSSKAEDILLAHLGDNGVANTVLGDKILVSSTVIRSLTKLKSQRVGPHIRECLARENLSVKLAAIEACHELKLTDAIPLLVSMLRQDDRLREPAHVALVGIVGKDFGDSPADWPKSPSGH